MLVFFILSRTKLVGWLGLELVTRMSHSLLPDNITKGVSQGNWHANDVGKRGAH